MSKEILMVADAVSNEKGVDKDVIFEAIEAALDKVHSGVNWWTQALDQLGTVHSLEFVIDETFARQPVATGYEPIIGNVCVLGPYGPAIAVVGRRL